MSRKICHEGVIDSIEEGCVHVRILQSTACGTCKVAGYCNAAEAKEKLIDVYTTHATSYQVGDAVTVSTSQDVVAHALLWAFGLPLVLMITVLVLVLWQTGNEGLAAQSSLLVLVPYYGLLFLLRHRMRRQMTFEIE